MPTQTTSASSPARQARRYTKHEAVSHWRNMPVVDPASVVKPIPYKHKGSTYAEDGIRVTGSKEFCEAVMSQMKSLLGFENGRHRLQLILQESTDRDTGLPTGSWTAYIQVHQRGGTRGAFDR